ncbi:uncharacterized protein LOC143068691 [Mytilus galloprovincialis]|uniref:uncharacterized protein LOC143068691 n=1 Tax=Mytilus galloprovincialis TaxID=29158 RepID=UPI003F7B7423
MSDCIRCGPCGYADNTRNAEKWCTVCEEGLCTDCEQVHKSIKTTRNHRLISTDDFQQIKNISISLTCKDHNKRLELYCKTHDVAVCLGCVLSHHRACSDVIPLDKTAENAKNSTALADLEDTLTIASQNLEQIINDRSAALKNLDGQKQTTKDTINDTRAKIMKKLDDLEQKLLLELDTQHGKCKSELSKLLNRLKNSERNLNSLKEQTSQLKSFASDIQLFLGTRQINKTVLKEVKSVKEGIKSVPNYEVNLQLHTAIIALMNEVDQLGVISVKENITSLPFKEAKLDQAQKQLPVQELNNINNIKFRLRKKFDVERHCYYMWRSGCTMLSNGNVLIADYQGSKVLMEYSKDGKHIRDIPCSRPPFDLSVIDHDRIAVTYGDNKYVEILNLKNNIVERKLKSDNDCYGISYQDNKLFIISGGIVIRDITGKVLKTLRVDCGKYLETTVDRIYYTVRNDHTVHCISMADEEIWVHKVESLIDLKGITVDDHQNVFIADQDSNLLTVIQYDGKASKTLLTETDGLDKPSALHYDKDKKMLLICNQNGSAALYNLE